MESGKMTRPQNHGYTQPVVLKVKTGEVRQCLKHTLTGGAHMTLTASVSSHFVSWVPPLPIL